jgi:uncharacterized protein YndB with AHSA1/START domain
MPATSSGAATLTMPSERELVITRVFDAPPKLVWEAMTNPEHVRQWYGLRSMTMSVCEIDLRPGGRWRYVMTGPDGGEFAFSGEYREIVPPERLVSTEGYEAMPGHDYLVTVTFQDQDGKTAMTSHLLYQNGADRDGHLQSGMEPGMQETFDRLNEHLATLS